MKDKFIELKQQARDELTQNILPFWSEKMIDTKNGGFYGQIKGNGQLVPEADKGGILNARILWSFSSAYLQVKNPLYLEMANRAKDYILNHFFDQEFGGTYWMVSYDESLSIPKSRFIRRHFSPTRLPNITALLVTNRAFRRPLIISGSLKSAVSIRS